MTDDTTETHIIFQRSLALAEATSGNSMADNNPIDNAPVAHKQHIDTKPDHISTETFITGKQESVEITDGKWKDLYLYRLRGITSSSPNQMLRSDNAGLIPVNYLLGIPHAEDGYVDAYSATYSGDYLGHYLWFKINKIKFSMKNFIVLVERDASGGIQLLDDIVFEIRKIYNKTPGSTNEGEPQNLVTHTLTDLKKGITMEIPFTQIGYFQKEDLIYKQEITQGAVKRQYVGYYFLSHLMGIGNADNVLFIPKTPLFHYQIRALNLPAGLSNIRVFMNFVYEINTQVDAIGRSFKTMTMNMPYLGSDWDKTEAKKAKTRINNADIEVPNKIIKLN